jgi:hypothetical protein
MPRLTALRECQGIRHPDSMDASGNQVVGSLLTPAVISILGEHCAPVLVEPIPMALDCQLKHRVLGYI